MAFYVTPGPVNREQYAPGRLLNKNKARHPAGFSIFRVPREENRSGSDV